MANVEKISNGFANGGDSNVLQAIRYSRGKLELLDQRKLPHESIYIDIPDSNAAWNAIHDMVVRGAPAIAISAALALAVELTNSKFENAKAVNEFIHERLDYLVSSRPTAVNLSDAAEKLKEISQKTFLEKDDKDSIIHACVSAAESMMEDDVASNKAIGKFGSESVLKFVKEIKNKNESINVLTHCNTGSLATAAYGTALGVIRSLFTSKKLAHCYCTETRPYNQGSRLTAFELLHDKIPATLIADSAPAYLISIGRVDAIIVGADRITANGDTANKIGTYSLAISANHHGIPFFVAAPISTVDLRMPAGNQIVIEERDHRELTHTHGGRGDAIAPSKINVWNPSFDVTPASLISAIITEKGVVEKKANSDVFDLTSFISGSPPSNFHETSKKEFYPLNESSLRDYLSENEKLKNILGGHSNDWQIREVGDGNINFVYIVIGPNGSMVVKQALPYIRCVGESWPMTLQRAYFEYSFLHQSHVLSPDHVPLVYTYDADMAVIAMQYLAPPHIILRKGLITRNPYPHLSRHVADYMAKTLFSTSLIALPTDKHRALISKYCANVEMCRLTEQVIFTEPYMHASNNRWNTPYLDDDVRIIQSDNELKIAIAKLKAKFCEQTQALIHGDLHTGSIMVTEKSTQIIDPEFAFVGPMGFDIGAFLANIFLSFFSQDGHGKSSQSDESNVEKYKEWLLNVAVEMWNLFSQNFINLWDISVKTSPGDAYPANVYNSTHLLSLCQKEYMKELFFDALGFSGAKIIRRIVGIAHVEDLESISEPEIRSVCEKKSLEFGKKLIKNAHHFPDIESVASFAKSI